MTRRSPILPEPVAVNVAVTRNEGYRSYPGRSHRREAVDVFEATRSNNEL